jgi:phage tail sheath protein FI
MQTSSIAPGVYVQEVSSGNAPIVGVGTSTAGFIGVIGAQSPPQNQPQSQPAAPRSVGSAGTPQAITEPMSADNMSLVLPSGDYPLVLTAGTYGFFVDAVAADLDTDAPITNDATNKATTVKFKNAVPAGAKITGYYQVQPAATPAPAPVQPAATPAPSTYTLTGQTGFTSVPSGQVQLCTNFSEFKGWFGDFSSNAQQNILAHAVYGFFRNGGTRCFVVWVASESEIDPGVLDQFAAIDEIALVVAPGVTIKSTLDAIAGHCKTLGDRFAIFDAPNITDTTKLLPLGQGTVPSKSDYAAIYFPWIQVFDPPTKAKTPTGDGLLTVPPSGHIAGIYARVDTQRGVHKAPANEPILGAVELSYAVSRAKQDGLNPQGINCIRNLNGNIRVWGARTLGGADNGETTYINVRRLLNYVRESIDEGTQWTVFEPNSPDLWAKIRRNVTAFLTVVWRSGALFGATPEQAFYVKCDEETNPLALREQGQVNTEIGIAIVKPAEFVIFTIRQWSGPGSS